MNNVKQYALLHGSMERANIQGNEAPRGFVRYVLAADYDTLYAENERIKVELEAFKSTTIDQQRGD